MAILSRFDEMLRARPSKWAFWRNLIIYFCVFSLVGHWLEMPYCLFMWKAFGIYDPTSLVWTEPMYPFLVYGVAVIVCVIILVPIKDRVLRLTRRTWLAVVICLVLNVLVSLVMELVMGLLLNEPTNGVYPLWNNSVLPLNVLGQAWLVNDVILGALATLYTWIIFPLCEKGMRHVDSRIATIACVVIVVLFIVLCVVTFS
ncbi:MAG: putative ABC transporter permease [Coriobacteriales bacterium]|jgi:uncharacterized membrane protein|nr:putative ABC transporter permease [Coriobacteriales bacterium]